MMSNRLSLEIRLSCSTNNLNNNNTEIADYAYKLLTKNKIEVTYSSINCELSCDLSSKKFSLSITNNSFNKNKIICSCTNKVIDCTDQLDVRSNKFISFILLTLKKQLPKVNITKYNLNMNIGETNLNNLPNDKKYVYGIFTENKNGVLCCNYIGKSEHLQNRFKQHFESKKLSTGSAMHHILDKLFKNNKIYFSYIQIEPGEGYAMVEEILIKYNRVLLKKNKLLNEDWVERI